MRGHRGQSARGFTLIEIMVVMLIIAGILGMSGFAVSQLTAGEMKATAREMTSAIRYTYSQAVINNTQYRMVIDLDQNTYHTEVVQSAFGAGPPLGEGEGEDGFGEEDEFLTEEARRLAAEREREDDLFDEEDDPFGMNRRVSYERVQDALLKDGKTRSEISIDRVIVSGGREREAGQAAINFYPSGQQDPAVIVLREGDSDAYFSLVLEPFTGRVVLRSGAVQVDGEFGMGESDE